MTTALEPRRYELTGHAIERVVERLGIQKHHATGHINNLMQSAYLQGVTSSPKGVTHVYDHAKSRTRIILSSETQRVITVYKHDDLPLYNAIETDFLRPALERELRKVKRESTRQIRAAERSLAREYAELAERMQNFANARNPNTRDLIQERIWETEEAIDEIKRNIECMMGEYESKVKTIEVING